MRTYGRGRPGDGPVSNVSGRPLLRRWFLIGLTVLAFVLAALVLSAAIRVEVGLQAALVALIVAVVPLGLVVPAFLWLDRFEAEPPHYLLFAFCWGALIATTVAMVLNTGSILVLQQVEPDASGLAAVMVAPVVEESLKGIGVLLILLFRRREFDGVVDGIVYAGLCAAGFAFAENVLYLGRAFAEAGPQGLAALFVIRGLLGPFAHPLFTMWFGAGVGVAATHRRGPLRFLAPIAGLATAIVLHGLWNLSAVAGIQGFWTSYLVWQMPIFVAAIVVVAVARWREGRVIARELGLYVRYGWLSRAEVEMLSSISRRRAARAWARAHGGRAAARTMTAFQDDASELALLRHRMENGTAGRRATEEEHMLLDTMTRCRAELP